jgi:hypothetical protein
MVSARGPPCQLADLMPKRSNLFQEIVAIIHRHMAGDAKVEESAMLTDRRTGQEREVDVTITQEVAGHEVIVAVEATASGRKATVEWVDQMAAKHEDLPTSELVLVAEAGFAETAKNRAEGKGITALEPEDLAGDDPGFLVVNRLRSLWTKTVEIVPEEVRLGVEMPEGKKWFKALPDHMLYTDTGREVDMVVAMIRTTLDETWQQIAERLGIANLRESGERNLELLVPAPPTVRMEDEDVDRPVCVQWTLSDPPELHPVIGFKIIGKLRFEVAEVPLRHLRLGKTAVAYGQSTDEVPSLLVVTEDKSGGKVTLRGKGSEGRGVIAPPDVPSADDPGLGA